MCLNEKNENTSLIPNGAIRGIPLSNAVTGKSASAELKEA